MTFSEAVNNGAVVLDGSVDPDTATRQLLAVDGIGPRTAAWFGMRSLRDPDSFPLGDAAVARHLGADGSLPVSAVESITNRWRPWRGYAAMYLTS